jgi:hypothetical protein
MDDADVGLEDLPGTAEEAAEAVRAFIRQVDQAVEQWPAAVGAAGLLSAPSNPDALLTFGREHPDRAGACPASAGPVQRPTARTR